MGAEFPVRAVLDDRAIDQLIAVLTKAGKAAGLSEGEIKKMNDELRKTGKEGVKGVNDVNKSLDNLVKNGIQKARNEFLKFFAVEKLLQLGKEIFNLTAEFQKMGAVLTNALGSRSAAQQALSDIQKFAAATPFQITELTESFVKLVNQGFKPTLEDMRRLGDVAASTGKSFDQLTEAIIDAQTGEFERLKEFGIRAQKQGDQVSFTFKGVKTQVDFTADSIRKYVLSLGDAVGVSGSMAAISATVGGKFSNLVDNLEQIGTALGNRSSGAIGGFLDLANNVLGSLNSALNDQVEALQTERSELNALVGVITDVNTPTEVRKKLIEDLNRKYPDFLKNLDTEKVTNEQLVTRLEDVNTQFQRKILLVAAEKELAKTSERIIELVNQEAEARLLLGRIKKGEVTAGPITAGGPQFNTNEQRLKALQLAAEEKINMALTERNDLLQEQKDKLDNYNNVFDLFNSSAKDYFGITEDGTAALKEQAAAEALLIKQMLERLEAQRRLAEFTKLEGERVKQIKPILDAEAELRDAFNKRIKKDRVESEKDTDEQLQKERDRAYNEEIKAKQEQEERKRKIAEGSFNFIADLTNQLVAIENIKIQNELTLLKERRDREIEAAGENAEAKKRINKKYDDEQKKLERAQSERARDQAVFKIILDTASAVVEALPNIPLSVAVGLAGLIQAGIARTAPLPRFAEGVYNFDGVGSSTSDSNLVRISKGEDIVPERRNKKFGFLLRPLIEDDSFGISDAKRLIDAQAPLRLKRELFVNEVPQHEAEHLSLLREVNANLQSLQSKKEVHLELNEDGFQVWAQQGDSWTKYVNKRYRS